MTVRRATLATRDFEFRAKTADDNEQESDGRTLDGYAAVFDQDTEINSWEGRFIERMTKGAFRKTLKENKGRIQMQWDHGRDFRVGTVPIGAYERLEEDDHGLHVIGRVFDNDVVEPIRQAIESGAVSGMSFKFRVLRDEWRDTKGKLVKPEELLDLLWESGERGPLRRTIKEVQLMEAGPVSTPAYGGTSVGVRVSDEPEATRDEVIEGYKRTMFVGDDGDGLKLWLEAEARFLEEERAKKGENPFAKDKDKDEDDEDDDSDDKPKKKGEDDEDEDDDDSDDPKKKGSKKKPETKSAGLDDAARRSTLSRLGFRYDAARTGTS